jgi:hypothetical protein
MHRIRAFGKRGQRPFDVLDEPAGPLSEVPVP